MRRISRTKSYPSPPSALKARRSLAGRGAESGPDGVRQRLPLDVAQFEPATLVRLLERSEDGVSSARILGDDLVDGLDHEGLAVLALLVDPPVRLLRPRCAGARAAVHPVVEGDLGGGPEWAAPMARTVTEQGGAGQGRLPPQSDTTTGSELVGTVRVVDHLVAADEEPVRRHEGHSAPAEGTAGRRPARSQGCSPSSVAPPWMEWRGRRSDSALGVLGHDLGIHVADLVGEVWRCSCRVRMPAGGRPGP